MIHFPCRLLRRRLTPLWAGFLMLGLHAGSPAQTLASVAREDGRPLALTSYAPASPECRGIALISHGAGGSEKGYAYLGEAMAARGYLAVVMRHQESDLPALRERMRGTGVREALANLITDPKAYRGRFMDLAAARQWAESRCAGRDALLLGHSMGAATVMMEAGALNLPGVQGRNGFKAYIALSPQGSGIIFPRHAWAGIQRPVLMMTGTRDDELGGGNWETRTEAFRDMPAGCKWLAVIADANHMQLAGIGMTAGMQARTVQVIGAFVEGLARGDCTVPPKSAGVDLQAR